MDSRFNVGDRVVAVYDDFREGDRVVVVYELVGDRCLRPVTTSPVIGQTGTVLERSRGVGSERQVRVRMDGDDWGASWWSCARFERLPEVP